MNHMNQNNLPQDSRGEPIWMVVATTGSIPEAAIIVGRLHSLGIPALIHNEGALPSLGLTFGSKVLVPEKYYAASLLVLEPDESTPWLDDGDGDGDDNDFAE